MTVKLGIRRVIVAGKNFMLLFCPPITTYVTLNGPRAALEEQRFIPASEKSGTTFQRREFFSGRMKIFSDSDTHPVLAKLVQ